MEFQEVAKEFRIAGVALAHEGKVHCGDYLRFSEIATEQLVLLALSDGVGSFHHDWVASKTACDSFIDSFTNSDISDLTGRFKHAISKADQAVSDPADPAAKGMMCTLIAVVWEIKSNEVLFCNIGDSRLFHHSATGLRQISVDEKKAVLMRDKSGKLLNQSGSLIVREGLTNALGYTNASINIEKQSFGFGDALVLGSDGMYELPRFTTAVNEILQSSDLENAVGMFVGQNKGDFADDASILILQRTQLPEQIKAQIHIDIAENKNCSEFNLPMHLVAMCIMEEFKTAISLRDNNGLNKLTKFVIDNNLKLSKTFLAESIRQIENHKPFPGEFYFMLTDQLKKLRQ